jgi:hypothetical protein
LVRRVTVSNRNPIHSSMTFYNVGSPLHLAQHVAVHDARGDEGGKHLVL